MQSAGDNDDGWSANIEEQYLQAIEAQPDYERLYLNERDTVSRNVWDSFQDAATSITQLYREKLNTNDTGALWLPFQTAAGTVTILYKDSCDGIKRTNELAIQCGYQRRTRELAEWARTKRRRYIKRDELLSYLAGKPPPPHHITTKVQHHLISPKPDIQHGNNTTAILLGQHHHNHHHHHHHHNYHHNHFNHQTASDAELHTFKEALARRPRAPELYAFVAGEIARHCKRPASPLDINMDVQSLSSKRQRFL